MVAAASGVGAAAAALFAAASRCAAATGPKGRHSLVLRHVGVSGCTGSWLRCSGLPCWWCIFRAAT
eukprot:299656-Amphidinium_carterae.1